MKIESRTTVVRASLSGHTKSFEVFRTPGSPTTLGTTSPRWISDQFYAIETVSELSGVGKTERGAIKAAFKRLGIE